MKQLTMLAGICLLLMGCSTFNVESKNEVDVKPIEIKPIHITIDINVKVDKALDDFFGDLDKDGKSEPAQTNAKK